MELSRYGLDPYEMAVEESSKGKLRRTFLKDGDGVELTAQLRASDGFGNVGFGVCQGKVLPAN